MYFFIILLIVLKFYFFLVYFSTFTPMIYSYQSSILYIVRRIRCSYKKLIDYLVNLCNKNEQWTKINNN